MLKVTTTEPIPYGQPFITPTLQPCTSENHTTTAARWSLGTGHPQNEIHPLRQGVSKDQIDLFSRSTHLAGIRSTLLLGPKTTRQFTAAPERQRRRESEREGEEERRRRGGGEEEERRRRGGGKEETRRRQGGDKEETRRRQGGEAREAERRRREGGEKAERRRREGVDKE